MPHLSYEVKESELRRIDWRAFKRRESKSPDQVLSKSDEPLDYFQSPHER
jgi:hypothetical protein